MLAKQAKNICQEMEKIQESERKEVAHILISDLGMSLDSKWADKDLKAVMAEKSKAYVTTFQVVKNQEWSYFHLISQIG